MAESPAVDAVSPPSANAGTAPSGPVAFGPFVLDMAQARLSREGHVLPLNGRPLQVLALLAAHPGRLLDKDAVLDAVWGHRHVTESVLKGAINTLRAALGDDAKAPLYVETVPRRGYRFVAAVAALVDAAPVASPASATAAPARGNLPDGDAGALVGREREAAQLSELMRRQRLVTLTGLGGIGKTRLALAVAAQDAPRDGAWLVRLDALADPALVLPAVAQALRLGNGAAVSAQALGQALASMQLRLVLDNAEHLIEAVAALVQILLDAAPGLHLLVTSQRALQLATEQVMPLPPLGLPADVADAQPQPGSYDAARLLCERVRQAQPGWMPQATEHADIAAICRALDGVPLALELAAARVPLLGIAGVRQRLDQRFQILTRGPRDAAVRHRTLAAALDWTYGLLSPAQRVALQRLAVFAGGFTVDAAEAVLDDDEGQPLDLLDSLRELSLVVADMPVAGAGPRLRLFDSVRQHALERLDSEGDAALARHRHLAWVCRHFMRADAEEFGTPLLRWLPGVRAEVDNLRAALAHGLRTDAPAPDRELALQALAASAMFWIRSGQRREGWQWMQAALALPASGRTAALRDHALGTLVGYGQMGTPQEGLAALRRARAALAADDADDARRRYLSLYCEYQLLLRTEPSSADALVEKMRALVRPEWGALQRRHLRQLEGFRLRNAGDTAAFTACCLADAAACRSAGGRTEAWTFENAAAQGYVMRGLWAEAAEVLDRSLAEVRAEGLLREQLPLLAVAATVRLRLGGDEGALALAREATQLLRAEGMLWWMADALPWAAWHAGRAGDALRLQDWADALVRQRGDTRGPLFGRLRSDFDAEVAAHPGSASLPTLEPAAPALDEMAALALALGPA